MYRNWLVPCLGIVLLTQAGCNIVAAVAYFLEPPRTQPAEIKLKDERLAMLVETARPEEANMVFLQALHEKTADIFQEQKIKAQLVPLDDILELQHENPDFADWSVQKIGQKLGADYVLYVRVDRLQLQRSPDMPLLEPYVQMRLKLIDTRKPAEEARVWPGSNEREGRAVHRARVTKEVGDAVLLDDESAKLGKDAAWVVSQWFYEVDLEQRTPWEP